MITEVFSFERVRFIGKRAVEKLLSLFFGEDWNAVYAFDS